ncbi:MAG: hypothetical protein ACM3P0_11910 [Acidobacteriota bacterium]
MKKSKLELLIYKSLDSKLTGDESVLLQNELQNSEEFLKLYKQIIEMRKAVSSSAETSFDPFFEQRVLSKLSMPETKAQPLSGLTESLTLSFRKVVLIGSVVLLALISYNVASGENYSIENIMGTYSAPLEYALDTTYNLIWSGI